MNDEPDEQETDPSAGDGAAGGDAPETPKLPGGRWRAAEPDQVPETASRRLDPSRASRARPGTGLRAGPSGRTTPVVDPRRYGRIVGVIGVSIVVVLSALLFITHGVSTPGVTVGNKLHQFVAPLAGSGIDKPANSNPNCIPSAPTAKALNMCNRKPIVLALFVTGNRSCVKEVDTLQQVSTRFPGVEFAALAVRGNLSKTEALVRSHHWTIPVGVDSDGRVGTDYGFDTCPLIEVARKGGTVVRRLIGTDWEQPARLAGAVRSLSTAPAPASAS